MIIEETDEQKRFYQMGFKDGFREGVNQNLETLIEMQKLLEHYKAVSD